MLTSAKQVGFVNPTLYAHPEVLNDIVNGSNPNCGTSGFKTAKGWDPVSADALSMLDRCADVPLGHWTRDAQLSGHVKAF